MFLLEFSCLVFSPFKKNQCTTWVLYPFFLLNILIRSSPACSRKRLEVSWLTTSLFSGTQMPSKLSVEMHICQLGLVLVLLLVIFDERQRLISVLVMVVMLPVTYCCSKRYGLMKFSLLIFSIWPYCSMESTLLLFLKLLTSQ